MYRITDLIEKVWFDTFINEAKPVSSKQYEKQLPKLNTMPTAIFATPQSVTYKLLAIKY